jgi:hypothetical protein
VLKHLGNGFLIAFIGAFGLRICGAGADWPFLDWVFFVLFMTPIMTGVVWFSAQLDKLVKWFTGPEEDDLPIVLPADDNPPVEK